MGKHERDAGSGEIPLTAKPHAFGGAVLSPKHARELTPALCVAIASALSEQSFRKSAVPYTLWITEAWRVLGWGEPSAALFWEMATMFHTLYLAGRAYASDFQESSLTHIPPILSCGSAGSTGSGTGTTQSQQIQSQASMASTSNKKKFSTVASAKELPVWLVGTFLLFHCEETAIARSLSAEDEQRFAYGSGTTGVEHYQGKVDFTSLLQHPGLSPRTRMHAGFYNDNTYCTMYLLRHLRKILLLAAVSHNPKAVQACMHLSAIPPTSQMMEKSRRASATANSQMQEAHRLHDEEHGNIGLNVRLTMDDLERLNFWMQPPSGGGIDDAPLRIGETLWASLYTSNAVPHDASIPLGEVEREVRRSLERHLLTAQDEDVGGPSDGESSSSKNEDGTAAALGKLSLSDSSTESSVEDTQRARQPQQGYQKELSYTHLRGTTILLKPNAHESDPSPSSGASTTSGDQIGATLSSSNGRLHDLIIFECSDVHMYLLQPFEHVTIAACTGCTIVVGAVAGLLHVVDCEKTTITASARRILVSNSCDVLQCVFTPSPPLLVGDNRNCQFAPYNTYYEGLRDDLLATGLAAAVVPEYHSPHNHGNRSVENDAAWPPLQCASNKWKHPVEVSKLEMPQVYPPGGVSSSSSAPGSPSSLGADDRAAIDSTMQTPVLLPASDFHVLLVPLETEATKQRRTFSAEQRSKTSKDSNEAASMESQYCRLLAEVLQLSPFHLPTEYERHALAKADRMRTLHQAMQKNLTEDQQRRFEEELNRGFRDWLVTSGNLRQVLDLVHMEKRASA